MANKKAVSIEQLSHFKTKQDLEYERKFKSKDDATDLKGAVRYDAAQALTEQEQAQARANIGAAAPGENSGSAEGAVLYTEQQALTDEEKARARANIGATDGTWANMTDKPFGELGTKIEWNGIPTSVYELFDIDGGTGYFYKVAEPIDTIIDKTICIISPEGNDEITLGSNVVQVADGGESSAYVINVKVPNSTFTHPAGADITFKEVGLYFFYISINGEISAISSLASSDYSLKQINKKYIPDDIKVELPEGIVTTDENGLIPASVLPSYVDDVVEGYLSEGVFYENAELEIAITGESGKIYVDLNDSGNTYRWSGSQYVQLNPPEITFATDEDIDALFT